MLSGAVQHSSTPARLANSAGNWSIKWITFHRLSLCTYSPRKVMGIEGNTADTYDDDDHSKWPTMAAKVSCTVKTATCSSSSSSSCKVCNNSYGSPRIWLCNLWKPTTENEFYFEWVLCLSFSPVCMSDHPALFLHTRVITFPSICCGFYAVSPNDRRTDCLSTAHAAAVAGTVMFCGRSKF